MGKLKICFVGWGHSIHTKRYCEWFSSRGYECTLLTNIKTDVIKGVRQFDITPISYNESRWSRYLKGDIHIGAVKPFRIVQRARYFLKKLNPDILHLHGFFYPNELVGLASMGLHIPIVVMPWNGDLLWSKKKVWWQKKIIIWLIKFAKIGLYDSDALKKALSAYGISNSKLFYCAGIDLKKFNVKETNDAELLQMLGVDKSRPIVLSPRSLGHFYRLDLIVKSIALVREKITNVLYVFCWAADNIRLKEKLLDLIEEEKVRDSVLILGHLTDEYLPATYRCANLVVSMSEKDSMPTSILEAMACNSVPVVAEHPPVCELAKHEETALVVPQGDHIALSNAIIRLLTDRDMYQQLANAGRELVENVADGDKNMAIIEEQYHIICREKVRGLFYYSIK